LSDPGKEGSKKKKEEYNDPNNSDYYTYRDALDCALHNHTSYFKGILNRMGGSLYLLLQIKRKD
jgi:hypothetical protein